MSKRAPLVTGAAFVNLFTDCPCCGQQISVLCRMSGNLAVVRAQHWNVKENEDAIDAGESGHIDSAGTPRS